MELFFRQGLLFWHLNDNERIMPWKKETDPYKIWMSEIILQQTRVEQGTKYYLNFIKKYPTIFDLASDKLDNIYKLWEGLGYYSRCKNMHITANIIVNEFNGIFPNTYQELIKLSGIGPYTAAAIASFAFNLPYPVLDGNVFRVVARFFGIFNKIDSTEGKKIFNNKLLNLIDKNQPRLFNQAIMDFGAVICKPINPNCKTCFLSTNCFAFNNQKIDQLPVKSKNIIKKKRFFDYLVFFKDDKIYIHKRDSKDIWENLYEFFLIENRSLIEWDKDKIYNFIIDKFDISDFEILNIYPNFSQVLTHQIIYSTFITIKINDKIEGLKSYKNVSPKLLKKYAFSKICRDFLEQLKVKSF